MTPKGIIPLSLRSTCGTEYLAVLMVVFITHTQSTINNGDSTGRILSEADVLQNVSKTIENLLKGYDIRLRPQFGGK